MPSAAVRIGTFIPLHAVVRAGGSELEYVEACRHLLARSTDLYLKAQVILYRPVVPWSRGPVVQRPASGSGVVRCHRSQPVLAGEMRHEPHA